MLMPVWIAEGVRSPLSFRIYRMAATEIQLAEDDLPQDEEGLVAEVQRHASEAHGMTLTHEQAMLLAFRAELDEQALHAMPLEPEARNEEEET